MGRPMPQANGLFVGADRCLVCDRQMEVIPLPDAQTLGWCGGCGCGRSQVPFDPTQYGWTYALEYERRAQNGSSLALCAVRWGLVVSTGVKTLLDFGCGVGAFLAYLRPYEVQADGYDLNPDARRLAGARVNGGTITADQASLRRWYDVICYWDSVEHLFNPDVDGCFQASFVAMTLPIYQSVEHCLGSKHFKPTEHLTHWTAPALITWMGQQGLTVIVHDQREQRLGREDIDTFLFQREIV